VVNGVPDIINELQISSRPLRTKSGDCALADALSWRHPGYELKQYLPTMTGTRPVLAKIAVD